MNKKLLRNCHSCHTPSRFLTCLILKTNPTVFPFYIYSSISESTLKWPLWSTYALYLFVNWCVVWYAKYILHHLPINIFAYTISYILPFCFMDKFSVWLTKQHRMHAYTLWLFIFLFIKYYTLCSFFYSNKKPKNLLQQYKKNLSNYFIFCCLIFGVEMQEKDKDKKQTSTITTDVRYMKEMEKQSTFQLTQLNEHLMKDLLIEWM